MPGATVPSGFSKRPHGADSDSDEEDAIERNKRTRSGAAIAPPTSLVQQDAQIDNSEGGSGAGSKLGGASTTAVGGVSSVAAKMMAKMGYVAGRGLGREGQGLTTALQVEKTSRRGGKIINEDTTRSTGSPNTGLTAAQAQVIAQAQAQAQAAAAAAGISGTPGGGTPAHCLGNPSRVILLQVTTELTCTFY